MFQFAIVSLFGEPFQRSSRRSLREHLRCTISGCFYERPRATLRVLGVLALIAAVLAAGAQVGHRFLVLNSAGKLGAADARYWVGRAIFNQADSSLEISRGLGLLREAATQGHVAAETSLGLIYAQGIAGIPQNVPEALAWFHKAADGQTWPLAALPSKSPAGGWLKSLFCSRERLDNWGAELAAKNLEMAAVACSDLIPDVTTVDGTHYRNVRILRLDGEGVFCEFVSERGTLGLAQIKSQALPGQLGRLCGYSAEAGVVPFPLWRQVKGATRLNADAWSSR